MATATKKKPKAGPAPVLDSGRSPQDFWAGKFGTDYTDRNKVNFLDRVPFFQHILEETSARAFLDVGCNAGWNLRALRHISAEFEMSGVDINHDALTVAAGHGFDVVNAPASEIVETFGPESAEMVITSGVLIHIAPADLRTVMEAIVACSSHWILCIEYEAQQEEAIDYRGHANRLWKRPFGQLYQDLGLSLVETGVAQGFDQCTYWLLEKS